MTAQAEIIDIGEFVQVRMKMDIANLSRQIKAGQIAPIREEISEARDTLTDTLKWMDESNGTRNSW